MNLKNAGGRVPLFVGGIQPYKLVDFPDRELFDSVFHGSLKPDTLDKYWAMLNRRREGETLAAAGQPYGLTRERVRQIEARFLRAMAEYYGQQ